MVQNMEDCLIIGFDSHSPEIDTLVVARKTNEGLTVINIVRDSDALNLYNKLIGK